MLRGSRSRLGREGVRSLVEDAVQVSEDFEIWAYKETYRGFGVPYGSSCMEKIMVGKTLLR